ncbi:MAG: hypothetical protein IT372_38030 [Polyangiaceae bacterium]|nr:hypothetical protein [Polyangiaceae bacterium]
MRLRPAALALALALAAAAASTRGLAAPGVHCSFYGMNAGAPVWQGQVILDVAYAEQMAITGARAARVNFRIDGAADWDAGKLAQYDGIIDAVIAAGMEPVGLLAYEAVNGGQAQWNDDPDGDGFNDYVDGFAGASQVLFDHFNGRVRRWEIWNEPNCWSNPGYANDPQSAGCTYILPRVFSKAMAEVFVRNEALFASGSVSMISGGLFAHDIGGSSSPATDYLGEVYSDGVWDWLEANKGRRYPWDWLGYHLYVDQGVQTDGAAISAYLSAVRDLAGNSGDPAPFSITEIGWTTAAVSEDVQAANLTTALDLLSARADVADVHWFSFRDAPAADLYFGLTTEGGAWKPALAAMQVAAQGCEAGGEGGGGAGGGGEGGSGAGLGGVVGPGPIGGGQGGPIRDEHAESSCHCEAAGGGRGAGAAWAIGLIAAAALGERRARRSRSARSAAR